MSELQSDDPIFEHDEYVEEVESEEITEANEPADLATDSDEEHEENPIDSEKQVNQDAINKRISQKHFEAEQAKREAAEYKRKLDEYEAQNRQQAPQVMERPDPFDDDYDSKLQAYEQSVRDAARYEYAQEQQTQYQQQQQQQLMQQQQAETEKKGKAFTQRAKEFGIDEAELTQSVQTVVGSGLSGDVGAYLLDHPEGALIVKHLAANFDEIEKLNGMNPFQAGSYVDNVIKPKAQALKPRKTNAPAPPTKVSGQGGDKDAGKYNFIGNAKFE